MRTRFGRAPAEEVAVLAADLHALLERRIEAGNGADHVAVHLLGCGVERGKPSRRAVESLQGFIKMRVAI